MGNHHFVDYPFGICVGNSSFKAVAYCDEYLTRRFCCLWLDDYDYSVVELSGSYLPVYSYPGSIFCYRVAFKVFCADDGYLIGGRVVECHQNPFQLFSLVSCKESCIIVDQTLGLRTRRDGMYGQRCYDKRRQNGNHLSHFMPSLPNEISSGCSFMSSACIGKYC